MQPRPGHHRNDFDHTGFTLVEVLVASLLFAIGMMAAMAMQYAALDGYAATRDVTNATELGHRVIQVLKSESQQWNGSGDLANVNSVYDTGGSAAGYWKTHSEGSLLSQMNSSNWTWTQVFDEPVDVRLSDGGPRKFCVFVRGGELEDSTRSDDDGTGIFQVHLAVVYSGPNQAFPQVADSEPAGTCNIGEDVDLPGDLNPPSDPATPAGLESNGYRVVYMGTQIIQREFLTNGYFGS